jgi:hypothetical protein
LLYDEQRLIFIRYQLIFSLIVLVFRITFARSALKFVRYEEQWYGLDKCARAYRECEGELLKNRASNFGVELDTTDRSRLTLMG